MVRLTDRPDMTLDVYRERKTTIKQLCQSRLSNIQSKQRTSRARANNGKSLIIKKENNLEQNKKISYNSGPGCSKLTASLVKVLLKF